MKYELNLKRDFPRIPFYENFRQWAEMGKQLMDLHINYETVEPFDLNRRDAETQRGKENDIASKTLKNSASPRLGVENSPKPKLKADKENGVIYLDSQTTLTGVPEIAWEYKLGNRSALEWILDQYKEKKPRDQTIAEKFDNYRFADYKEQVIDLLQRVCTVSVETMKIVKRMETKNEIGENES